MWLILAIILGDTNRVDGLPASARRQPTRQEARADPLLAEFR